VKSIPYYERGIRVVAELGEKEILSRLLFAAGDIQIDLGQFAKAKSFLTQSLDTAVLYRYSAVRKLSHLSLSYLALLAGDRTAYRSHRETFQALNDSLLNETVIRTSSEWETRFETAQKEKEIERLEQINAIHAFKIQNRNRFILSLILLLLLTGLAIYFFYQNTKRKKKISDQAIELQQQKIKQLEQEKQLAVSGALLQGQEKERSRLAKDLHDGLGGMLSGIKQHLSSMKGNQIITETGVTALNQVISDMDHSIQELRHIARNMMPEALLRFGLPDALQDYCVHMEQSTGISVSFRAMGFEARLPEQYEIILFRITQELLNNAIKHAQASRIIVQLQRDHPLISLTVEDNGKGFDAAILEKSPGTGWLNIQSRVEFLKGKIDLRSQPGEGTSVHIEIPLE
jgi:signal transduction histidine kinase